MVYTPTDLNTKIPGAENFTYKELVKSDVAIRKNIKNIPNEEQWKNLTMLAVNVLQPVRNKFGSIKVNSAFRCPELNSDKEIGGSKDSNHTRGEAADIEAYDPDVSLYMIADFICHNLEFRELICEYWPDGWVHVAFRQNSNIKTIKLKDANHYYKRARWEYIEHLYLPK